MIHVLTRSRTLFQLSSPKLSSIAKGGKESAALKPLSKSALYLQWEADQVKQVYAAEGDSTFSVNIKKGIASLLQLHTEDAQRTEVLTLILLLQVE